MSMYVADGILTALSQVGNFRLSLTSLEITCHADMNHKYDSGAISYKDHRTI